MINLISLSFIALTTLSAHAACISGKGAANLDLLKVMLEKASCPKNVSDLKNIIAEDGLKSIPAMVANRGAHNPNFGSFSIFESVKGSSKALGKKILPEHLYFGHFTALTNNKEVILDQVSSPNKLLIEAIAYDFKKGIYNFYELVGMPSGPQWFYRGDSQDAYEDNKLLKIDKNPMFGSRMRCSGCHISGGPIMKELTFPHNDWWSSARGLSFGKNQLSKELAVYLTEFIDASEFSKNVKNGIVLLEKKGILTSRSLKEKLRPLFCSTEINLKSDSSPLSASFAFVNIPSDVFVDPLLGGNKELQMRKDFYVSSLRSLGSHFPETNLLDADHAFLAPVRSEVNHHQVKQLISEGIIDEEFAVDVLSIDFINPLFSKVRCDLLKLIPESNTWKESFKRNLFDQNSEFALELAHKLELENRDQHRSLATKYLEEKQISWSNQKAVTKEVVALNSLRQSVFADTISKNPRGQILEPGFRVIFPNLEEGIFPLKAPRL